MSKAWLCLFLFSPTSLLAEPRWRIFEPPGQGFRCQLPAGEITQPRVQTGHQWMLARPGQYAFQLGYAKRGPGATGKVFVSSALKSAHISESKRQNITHRGLSGVEVAGTLALSKNSTVPVRLRIFPVKDRVYTLNVILVKPTDSALADRFFSSFQLTK